MKKIVALFFIFLMIIGTVPLLAGELEEVTKEKEAKEEELLESEKKLEEVKRYQGNLSSQLYQMQQDLESWGASLSRAMEEIAVKERELDNLIQLIEENEKKRVKQEEARSKRIRSFYINSQISPLSVIFGSNDVAYNFAYHLATLGEDKRIITFISEEIGKLSVEREQVEEQRKKLEEEKGQVARQIEVLNQQISGVKGQIAGLESEKNELVQQMLGLKNVIGDLTNKQREVLAAKAAAAAASTSVGETEVFWEAISQDPPQEDRYYSFWTYGYPHRVCMNQYGAYGRALAGQSAEEILGAYYPNTVLNKEYEIPETIPVEGYGEIKFEEEYLKGIGEMPASWPIEALRAQAVAARTYALNYIYHFYSGDEGQVLDREASRPICTTQACQVYLGHPKGGAWDEAVQATRGWVLTYQGKPVTSWYASTAGGFTLSSAEAWGGFRPWSDSLVDFSGNDAFDGPKWGNSPWYHKAWGDQPWLSFSQVTDLLNAALMPDSYNEKLAASPDGFSEEEVLNTLELEGVNPVIDLKAIEVLGADTKATKTIRAYYQDTYVDIDAERFRFVFNLRSPGTDAIWTTRWDVMSN